MGNRKLEITKFETQQPDNYDNQTTLFLIPYGEINLFIVWRAIVLHPLRGNERPEVRRNFLFPVQYTL